MQLRVLYVGGYGRSRSTALERALANHLGGTCLFIEVAISRAGCSVMTDSSKTSPSHFRRPQLLRDAGFDVSVVLPIRSFPDVLQSRLNRAARDGSAETTGWRRRAYVLETAASWAFAVTAATRYDPIVIDADAIAGPERLAEVARRTCELLEFDSTLGAFSDHMVGGNRMRFKSAGIEPETRAPTIELSNAERMLSNQVDRLRSRIFSRHEVLR